MFGGGGFGSSPSTFGTGGFGTATSTGGGLFGQPAQQQQQPAPSLFGGGSTVFGAQQQASLPAFGAGAATGVSSGFSGQPNTASVFGQQTRPTTGIFSSTANTMSPFSTQTQSAGTSIPFSAITSTDTMMKNGAASQINTRHQCITCMKEYENKSLEELRLEDYNLNRKGPTNSMFGANTSQTQPGGSLFSGIGGATGISSPGTNTLGQTSAFGQTAGTTGGGLFSSLNQPKPGGFFGGTGAAPTSTSFGTGSTLGFSFNNPTSQPQTSFFGSNTNTATSNTQPAFSFSSQQPQQQQQGLTLFGQKPLTTPASSAPTFGGAFGSAATNTTGGIKPLFGGGTTTFGTGTAAPAFGGGTGSIFSNNPQQQQQQQNKPFSFSTPFSSTAQPNNQLSFGQTNSTSSFSFSNPVSSPAVNFGTGTAPAFGSAGMTSGTGSTFGAPLSFSLQNNPQQQQSVAGTGTTFGTGFFSSGTNNPAAGGLRTGPVLFGGNTGTSTLGSGFGTGNFMQMQNPQQLQMQQQFQQQQQMMPGTISFATTPFKDNELFYNLISNRKVEDICKPISALAQKQLRQREAARRKSSATSASASTTLSASPAVKSLTFPTTLRNSSITKYQIFDGFHDEDYGIGVDILSPKSDVKKLILKETGNNSSAASSTSGNGDLNGMGLSARASMLIGNSTTSRKSDGQSPLLEQRRSRLLTLNSSLNNSCLGPDSTHGMGMEPNRTIDFNESSILASDVHARDDSFNKRKGEGANGDVLNISGEYPKRRSDGDFGAGERSSPSQAVDSNAGSVCGVTCTRAGVYLKPSLEELDRKVDQNGNCFVDGLEIGRHNFGRITFLDTVNVANINIDEIVLFRHKEVVVYPDDENKPEVGLGLNVPAAIELVRVWPVDKATNELIRSPEKIRELNYEQKLRKACIRLGAEFVGYSDLQGLWKFNVSHFSKYSCDLEEEEEEQLPSKQKGLGGMPQQKGQPPVGASKPGQMSLGPGGDAHAHPGMYPPSKMPMPAHMAGMKFPAASSGAMMMEGGSHPVSDVEMNPLTPCDSDDDDDDDLDDEEVDEDLDDDGAVITRRSAIRGAGSGSLGTSVLKYKPILKDSGTDKSRIMKSVLSMEDFSEEESSSLSHSQPPIKKSRPGKVSIATTVGSPDEYKSSQKLRERLQKPNVPTHKQSSSAPPEGVLRPPPPAAVVCKEPVTLSEGPVEDLFAALRSKVKTTGIRLQGCPRVCFLPGGHFLTINQSGTRNGFKASAKIHQLLSYADKQAIAPLSMKIRFVLEKQMECRLTMEGVLFKDYINILQRALDDSAQVPQLSIQLRQELVIWELCDILWPEESNEQMEEEEDHGMLLRQRKRLEGWLKRHAQILFGPEYDPTDKSVLGLMKKGCIEDACIKAVDQDNLWLGATLASEPHLLLDFDGDEEVLNFMPPDTPDIISLVSGNPVKLVSLTGEKVMNMTTYDWLQHFALFFWYESPVKSQLPIPVDQSVREFEEMMRKIAGDDECALPSTETSSIANLAMHLLKMHSCTGYPLRILLSPRTYTTDCLDYKLAWLLMRDMEEIGYLPGDEVYKGVCLGFSGMLEAIGLWKWAIFVMKNLPGPECEAEEDEELERKETMAREVFQQRILERNLSDQSSEEEAFLVNQLQTSKALIYSIKAWRSAQSNRNRMDETMWYLGEQGHWQKAYEVLLKYLTSPHVLDLIGNRLPTLAKNMRKHLERLEDKQFKITGWEVQGRMLENYLSINDPNGDDRDRAVLNFLESVIKFKPSNTIQCAFLLDMALSAQKVIQLLLTEQEVDPELRRQIESSLVKFMELPVPKEYFTGLSSFIGEYSAKIISQTEEHAHGPRQDLLQTLQMHGQMRLQRGPLQLEPMLEGQGQEDAA